MSSPTDASERLTDERATDRHATGAKVLPTDGDWVARFADETQAEVDRRAAASGAHGPIVCASGISPSGPVHLGNLRELLTPHLVADELRRRHGASRDVVHLLSWDDYDRFRRVPLGVDGVDASWAEHIGRPLTSVPAPAGSPHPNWAEHFKAPLVEALDRLGVEVRPVSQTQQYTSGAYVEQVLLAMRERERIGAILGRYRTKQRVPEETEGSGAATEDDGASASGYFPYKPYCARCGRDTTKVTAYDDATTAMTYVCDDGFTETLPLREHRAGKLVWKVDWPMRWAYEGVVLEPSGVDHSSPGSSFVVGRQVVEEVFGAEPPIGPMYAFVGTSGMAKMSSSRGAVPTPLDALGIMEAPLLRWLYARRRPNQSITVAFDQEIQRLYDEWDSLGRKIAGGDTVPAGEVAGYARAVATAVGAAADGAVDGAVPAPLRTLEATPRPLPYRTLASVADVTTGDPAQTLRILGDLDPADPVASLDEVRPRLDRATRWVVTYLPADQRTHVRPTPDADLLGSLGEQQREALRLLRDGLDEHWSLDGLTALVYGVPKRQAGLPPDTAPTPELKAVQREFFALLYRLLVGRDTGPRLPTLLLAVGADRIRALLTPPASP